MLGIFVNELQTDYHNATHIYLALLPTLLKIIASKKFTYKIMWKLYFAYVVERVTTLCNLGIQDTVAL